MMNESDTQTTPIVELASDFTITLPAEVTHGFRPNDRFAIWPQGDMLILKRVTQPKVTDIVAAAPEDDSPLSMAEINEIVHEVRKQRT